MRGRVPRREKNAKTADIALTATFFEIRRDSVVAAVEYALENLPTTKRNEAAEATVAPTVIS
jgi:hypothetical protein